MKSVYCRLAKDPTRIKKRQPTEIHFKFHGDQLVMHLVKLDRQGKPLIRFDEPQDHWTNRKRWRAIKRF